MYRVFIKYCVFLWFFLTLPVLQQRWFSTCLLCVHKLKPRENRVRNILKNSEKNTIFNEHPVHCMHIIKYFSTPTIYLENIMYMLLCIILLHCIITIMKTQQFTLFFVLLILFSSPDRSEPSRPLEICLVSNRLHE